MKNTHDNTYDNTYDKVSALRTLMKEQDLDAYIVPKADEYQGEFVAPYAERLLWLSEFTGSAGIAVILQDKACVLSDGRYTLQLVQQVDTELFETADSAKTGAHGWLAQNLDDGAVIGFDPWLHTPDQIEKLEKALPHAVLKPVAVNLVDLIWEDQPEKPCGKIEVFPAAVAGLSVEEKKKAIIDAIQKNGASSAIMTLPDSIAWLLNVRGSDIDYIPVTLSYAIVFADETLPVQWVVDPGKINDDVKTHLGEGVRYINPSEIGVVLKALDGPVMLDFAHSPEFFKSILQENGTQIINAKDPCIEIKSVKTPQEFEAIKQAHILDGIAVTKLLYWLSQNNKAEISERSIAEKIHQFRSKHEAYKGPSFPTISGFGENGAIVHYRATSENNKEINEDGLLLLDSGGQYYDGSSIAGTTDITRTVAIGPPSQEMRERFTLVLKGHIALAMAHFPEGTTGVQIDTLARQALWNHGLDFAHGTGHGVGCYLAVHEEAANISPKGHIAFKPGMLISNEPGYYKAGEYGIRIENLVFVLISDMNIDTGAQMMRFETVSFAPIDLSLIEAEMLSPAERDWLNRYHADVYEKISGFLDQEERDWLKAQTAPI